MKERLPAAAGVLGILGSLACSAAMVMALVGIFGTGVAATAASSGDMGGMTSATAGSSPHNSSLPSPLLTFLFFLFQSGPVILIVSIAAVALAVGLRRRVALLPVIVAGIVLYWGMYIQGAKLMMYSAVVVGMAALVAASVWSVRTIKQSGTQART